MNYKKTLDKRQTGMKLYDIISSSEYTYEEIAEYLNLTTPRVIYDWTNGRKMPNLENLWNLSELLHFKIEDILS